MYQCKQDVIVLNTEKETNKAFYDHILTPQIQFVGLDCEWNTRRPVSLLQVSTPKVVLLVRVCKLNFILPANVKLVLEDPTILKIGVNIDNDSDKLEEDCACKIRGWVDLRYLAITSPAFGQCALKQARDLEWDLKFFDQTDPNSESYKIANGKRLSWSPKMGLEALMKDCFDLKLPKNNSPQWKDDWEAKSLNYNQQLYAANDAASGMDIFVTLVSASKHKTKLPLFDIPKFTTEMSNDLEDAAKEWIGVKYMQSKSDMDLIHQSISAADPNFDIKPYFTKPAKPSLSREKQSKKQYYKAKNKKEKAAKALIMDTQKNAGGSDTASDKDSGIVEESPDLTISSNKSSFNYDEIQSALKHTTQNAVLNENFLHSREDSEVRPTEEEGVSGDHVENRVQRPRKYYTYDKVLFYFKHIIDRTAELIPGFSFGRGSVPPKGYRLFLQGHQQTQTHTEYFRIEDMKYSPQPIKTTSVLDGRFSDVGFTTDLHFSHDEQKTQISARFEPRTESPTSTTEDETGSSCSSSNYMSTATTSSRPSTKGRGRGRGKSVKGNVSDTDSIRRKGRGRAVTVGNLDFKPTAPGRGRGSVGNATEQSLDCSQATFNSDDIRYMDAQESKSPDLTLSLNSDQQSLRHSIPDELSTPMSTYSDKTLTNSFLPSEGSIVEPPTPTNSHFESNYSEFELPGIIPPRTAPYRGTRDRAYRQQTSLRDSKSSGEYQYNSSIFRNIQHGSSFDPETEYAVTKKTETIKFDWSKFREEEGLEESSSNTPAHVSLELSDSDISSADA